MKNGLKSFFGRLFGKKEKTVKAPMSAEIEISRLYYNTSRIYVDENGERIDPPTPEPKVETVTVKPGDRVEGFDVVDVTDEFILLHSGLDFIEDGDSSPKAEFVCRRGYSLDLSVYGLYDAVDRVSIMYLDRQNSSLAATKNDWEIYPMPQATAKFTLKRHFTDDELEKLKLGHIPGEMEDRWFCYYEDGKLFVHRSWSGSCIYIMEFSKSDRHKVTVNRDSRQYTCTDNKEDAETLACLLDQWC